MRSARIVLVCLALLLPLSAVHASERGIILRAGDLYAEPFIDANKLGAVAPNQPVTIVERRGGWLAIETGGRRGWVRMLIVRLEAAPQPGGSTAALRTGSTGTTVATGVKGLDDADIRNAGIDRAQLAKLDMLGADDNEARKQAARTNLKEAAVPYLKPGKAK